MSVDAYNELRVRSPSLTLDKTEVPCAAAQNITALPPAQALIRAACEAFQVSEDELTDHARKGADVLDARAAVAWVLHRRHGYSGQRAAIRLGYASHTKNNLAAAWDRLRLRVLESPRLRAQAEAL